MDQIKIGRFVAETRRAKGLTQRQLADQLSISDASWPTSSRSATKPFQSGRPARACPTSP